jgi:hypothetical protein
MGRPKSNIPTRSIHVKIPVMLYEKLWGYVKSNSNASPQGMYSKIVREALEEYLSKRGVNINE